MNKKQYLQIFVLIVACILTIANSAAPRTHNVIQVQQKEGEIHIETEKRLYVDKPCTFILPKDNYIFFTISLINHVNKETPARESKDFKEIVLKIEKGDSRLQGDPVRILFTAKPKEKKSYKVEVANEQGQTGILIFNIAKRR